MALPIIGDKVIGLIGPDELRGRAPRPAPAWLPEVVREAATAAEARLRRSAWSTNRSVHALVRAIFEQSVWSGPLLSARTASSLWGKAALVRAMPKYRLADLVVMRDNKPLDLSPLGKPTARLGKNVEVLLRELHKPNTGFRLGSVQLYHPRVRTFADRLAKLLATKVNVNGYASFSQGTIFPEHWDAHDVALVQTHGRKEWRVRPNSLPMPVTAHRSVLRPHRGARPTTFRLAPGRLLFLPRGHWHVGKGLDSIHLTFGLPEDTVALRIADAALWTLARHIQEVAYRAPMFVFDPQSPQAHTALRNCIEGYLSELRSALLDTKQLSSRPAFFGRRFF